ncbi:MAG: trypsin-like peptidase domain-containing protein [Pseudomonadota bacterium]
MRHMNFAALACRVLCALSVGLVLSAAPRVSHALPPDIEASVVSVLPVWPGRPQGGTGNRPGTAPEGSGVVVRQGIIATAWHVIEPAERIDVRLSDGRILPAELIARDVATDIAVLSVAADLPSFSPAPRPSLADRACAIGNAWGLGLSVTCGVVSARDVTNAGFNRIEHFIQTDAAANPGVSGGALVDEDGRLLGMMSAIFASQGDTNIGVNFAVSVALLERVVDALLTEGEVGYPDPGWRLIPPDPAQLAVRAAPVVAELATDGVAAAAGVLDGDLILAVRNKPVRTPRDVLAALALLPEGSPSVDITLEREGQESVVTLLLNGPTEPVNVEDTTPDCPHPVPVCVVRQSVFPVSSFDPIASATRIGSNLLVTNRHVVGDRKDVVVHTPAGSLEGRVIGSAYVGDLALIEVGGLPEDGLVLSLGVTGASEGPFFAVGADVARQEVRVFTPGARIASPAQNARLGRVHVSSAMQPGVSGGALVDAGGALVGIAVGGGEGRYEAIPVEDVQALLDLRSAVDAEAVTARLGQAYAACAALLDSVEPRQSETRELEQVGEACAAAENHGQLLEAGRVLAMAGAFEDAAALHTMAVEQVPNSINARVSLLVSMQLGARFEEMLPHARRVMELAPDDPQVLRFAIQAGVWGGAPELAEDGYAALLLADPRQAEAARRFIDNAPPAPERR